MEETQQAKQTEAPACKLSMDQLFANIKANLNGVEPDNALVIFDINGGIYGGSNCDATKAIGLAEYFKLAFIRQLTTPPPLQPEPAAAAEQKEPLVKPVRSKVLSIRA